MSKQIFTIAHDLARQRAIEAVKAAPDGQVITISDKTRNLDQNAKFHAICSDVAKQRVIFAGKPRTAEQWKVLLVSGHATATNEGAELTIGMEGEVVNLRESTALMSIKRSASLIAYALAWCDMQGVRLSGERLAA